MGQGGEQIIHWETKEKVLGLIEDIDHKHRIKHSERVAEMAVCYNGKTINDLCEANVLIADSIMYKEWRAKFLGIRRTPEDRERDEFDRELYYFYNTIICNSEK